MNTLEYIVLAVSSLFVIVDPLGTVPAFISMTSNDTPAERARIAKIACLVMACILLPFVFVGKGIFTFLSIEMPAFQVAASIVLMLVALDMLRAQRSPVLETSEETEAGAEKTDIAVTPLAVPLLAGPGAISTIIVLQSKAKGDLTLNAALFGSVVLVVLASYITLRMAAHGAKWLSPIALRISTRIMGLLLAAIAVQFFINGIKELKPGLLN